MKETQWLKAEIRSPIAGLEHCVVSQEPISGKAAVICMHLFHLWQKTPQFERSSTLFLFFLY